MPHELPIIRVNAFGRALGLGNPCAVVLDAGDLDTSTMQRITHDQGLSETAFVLWTKGAKAKARYFTPQEEIPLAGHPTLSVGRALVEAGRVDVRQRPFELELELNEGPIGVRIEDRGEVSFVTMTQRRPSFGRTYAAAEVLPVFGLAAGDALPGAPIETVSTGTPQLMIPLRDRATLERARLDEARYEALKAAGDFFSPHLFCLGGVTPEGDTYARHLGVGRDVPEDPFTGSATGNMGAYLWRHGLIERPRFRAEQGHFMGRPGIGEVEVVGPRNAIETVRVAGEAITVSVGLLRIPD